MPSAGKKGLWGRSRGNRKGDQNYQEYLTMTINGINAFLGLPVATQSLLSWSFLAFLVYFVSGFWTFKIGLAIFLLLFRPLSSTQLAFGAKKRSPRQRDAHGQLFSADPLVSALQRIPDTVSYGNEPPSGSGSSQLMQPLVDSQPQPSSDPPTPPPKYTEVETALLCESPRAQADTPRPDQSYGMHPHRSLQHSESMPIEALPAAAVQRTPDPRASLGHARMPTTPMSPRMPTPSTPAMRQTSTPVIPTTTESASQAWQRGPSGNFHRIDQAKKAWKRNFSSKTRDADE